MNAGTQFSFSTSAVDTQSEPFRVKDFNVIFHDLFSLSMRNNEIEYEGAHH